MNKPHTLKKGDTIGIAASSSPFNQKEFMQGVKMLEDSGFKIYYRNDIFEESAYLAGNDQRRLSELNELITNPDIKAILFARGGYGFLRLLNKLNEIDFPKNPKIILGYSDVTSFHIYLNQKLKWPTFYGPVVSKDLSSRLNDQTKEAFLNAITSSDPLGPFEFDQTVCIKKGVAEGELVGGCLSLICSSLGTDYAIQTADKILFIEDTNEKPYAVDRMLTQLKLAGKLEKAKGILIGSFENGGSTDEYTNMLYDVLQDYKGPVLYNFPAGHSQTKITLSLGVKVRLSAENKTLEFLESACK